MLHLPDGAAEPLAVRSIVGLIPLFAVETLEPELLASLPVFKRRVETALQKRPDLAALVSNWNDEGRGQRRLLSLLRGRRMKRLLKRLLDEREFLSPYGVRSLSRVHLEAPFTMTLDGVEHRVDYEPGESRTGLFGGNSNWRGPVWFPMNYLLIEALERYHHFYGDTLKVECPTGSGVEMDLLEVATEIRRRLAALNAGRRQETGDRPGRHDSRFFRQFIFHQLELHLQARRKRHGHARGWQLAQRLFG